ncbi:hypothetical protein A0H76_2138 [Hepatospora eriocheir]|uniref:Uncharacterized protein n=1 Tax=Hepatospora eriocheir TaxID=1081669 RepID=A0A1X0QG53_9MICR|nr:hypothetical protein A0H76_2138 [Hepatospora eriocheir]
MKEDKEDIKIKKRKDTKDLLNINSFINRSIEFNREHHNELDNISYWNLIRKYWFIILIISLIIILSIYKIIKLVI